MAIKGFTKDPDEVLDYAIDWSNWLATGESITCSLWLTTGTLVTTSASHTTSVATIWLSAGTTGTVYNVTNRIGTSGSRLADRSISIRVKAR